MDESQLQNYLNENLSSSDDDASDSSDEDDFYEISKKRAKFPLLAAAMKVTKKMKTWKHIPVVLER